MSILSSIIEIFEKNDNYWLDYSEIYEQLDQNLFGPNKNGEQGKKNMVSRNIVGNLDLFDVDENFRPKKYKLKTQNGIINPQFINSQIKYTFGDSKIMLDGDEYKILEFSSEDDFEDEVKENYQMIFGSNSIYIDLKKKLGNRICDGFVYDKNLNRLIIVENELCIHDLWGHIIPQIIGFFNAVKTDEVKMKLKYDIDWGVTDSDKLMLIEAIDKCDFDIVVVIDKVIAEMINQQKSISNLVLEFAKNKNIRIYFKELKVFINSKNKKLYQIN
jgi:hypothetical protein